MACAIVLSGLERKENIRYPSFKAFKCWLRKFSSAEITIENKKLSEAFSIYLIIMPHPNDFMSKNKHGQNRTIRNWMGITQEKQINCYLLDKGLATYLKDGWNIDQKDLLKESLRQKFGTLSKAEPLKGLEYETLTITVSGIKKEHKTKELLGLLRKFRNVNTIEENGMDIWWEEFMTETGVPVCKTIDSGVLQRSDIWLSLDDSTADYSFNGVKIDIPGKRIICSDTKKHYKIGYIFLPRLISTLGVDVIHRFGYGILANFLLTSFIAEKGQDINSAEKALGIDIMIMASSSA